MPLFGSGNGFPLPNPLSPIHADPVARAIGPGANRNRPHRGQLGWPQIRRLRTIAPLPQPTCVACVPGRLADTSRAPPKGCPTRPSGSPSPTVTRRLGLTRRLRSCLLRTPTPRCPRLPENPVEMAGEPVLSQLRCASSAVWAGPPTEVEGPLLTAPCACALRNDAQ